MRRPPCGRAGHWLGRPPGVQRSSIYGGVRRVFQARSAAGATPGYTLSHDSSRLKTATFTHS